MYHIFQRTPGKLFTPAFCSPGIQVVVEVGLGLGVFAGDALGIGNNVRQLSAAGRARVVVGCGLNYVEISRNI